MENKNQDEYYSRSAKQIVDEMCTYPDKALQILHDLKPEEIERLASTELLLALQRARGLGCYETLAAYVMGVGVSLDEDQKRILDLTSRCDMLLAMLNMKIMTERALKTGRDGNWTSKPEEDNESV